MGESAGTRVASENDRLVLHSSAHPHTPAPANTPDTTSRSSRPKPGPRPRCICSGNACRPREGSGNERWGSRNTCFSAVLPLPPLAMVAAWCWSLRPMVPHRTTNSGSSWHNSTGHRLCLRPVAQQQPDLGIRAHGMLVVLSLYQKEFNHHPLRVRLSSKPKEIGKETSTGTPPALEASTGITVASQPATVAS